MLKNQGTRNEIYSKISIWGLKTASWAKAKGIHNDWSNLVKIMNTQRILTTSMKDKSEHMIYIKKCSESEKDVKEIYRL